MRIRYFELHVSVFVSLFANTRTGSAGRLQRSVALCDQLLDDARHRRTAVVRLGAVSQTWYRGGLLDEWLLLMMMMID
jgi:hypothetical protein